jgi:hypothetical protein
VKRDRRVMIGKYIGGPSYTREVRGTYIGIGGSRFNLHILLLRHVSLYEIGTRPPIKAANDTHHDSYLKHRMR